MTPPPVAATAAAGHGRRLCQLPPPSIADGRSRCRPLPPSLPAAPAAEPSIVAPGYRCRRRTVDRLRWPLPPSPPAAAAAALSTAAAVGHTRRRRWPLPPSFTAADITAARRAVYQH